MIKTQGISEHEISQIKKIIRKNTSINLGDFKIPFLTRRINARMMIKGVRTGSEYAKLLESDPLESISFYKSLSINVTECFRDPPVWNIFMNHVIPLLVQNKGTKRIRVWSAGCATGQEPYSIAMMLAESIGTSSGSFEIIATDMNNVSIGIAKTARYDKKTFKNIPHNIFSKYVIKLQDQLYEICDDLKNCVNFQVGDISSCSIDSLDLIVCRNLLIYYGKNAQELLLKKFFNALNKDGYLILGMDESMIGTIGTKLFDAIYPRERIFQKITSNK